MNDQPRFNKSLILSCFLASCLEIYDFVIFAFFVPVLQKKYFVFLDESLVLLVSYILFAVGFIFRPIGSLIFGYIGDIYGRKKSLVTSVSLMGICSLVMFLLPSYQAIGLTSCFIIVLVRIIQGLSVGGEFTGALIFAMEHTNQRVIGLIGGVMSAGGAGGVLLATIISNFLQNPAFPEEAWRLAFLLGFSLSIIGYIIRTKLSETPFFITFRNQNKKIPLIQGFKEFKLNSLATILIAAANGTTFYFAVIFLPNFLKQTLSFNSKNLPILITTLILVFAPLVGHLADRLNKKAMLIGACFIMSLYIPIMLTLISKQSTSTFLTMVYLSIYCLIFSTIASMSNILAVQLFPPQFRMSCTSFFYSIGMGVIGGTVPTISALIVKTFGSNPLYVSFYISIICLVASVGFAISCLKGDSNNHILQKG